MKLSTAVWAIAVALAVPAEAEDPFEPCYGPQHDPADCEYALMIAIATLQGKNERLVTRGSATVVELVALPR